MSVPDKNDPLAKNARLRGDRHKRWIQEGEDSVARRLAQIGVLGWMVVLPTLAGIFVGRWLDQEFETGIFFTAPLLLVGVTLGFWFAWRWMHTQ